MGSKNVGIDQCGEKTENKKEKKLCWRFKTLLFFIKPFFLIDFVISLLLYMTELEKSEQVIY